MTIAMPDSITPGNIPMGYPAVLGYADGDWPTAARLPELFPKARHVVLTVLGGTLAADGIDCEDGNGDAGRAADWVRRKLAAQPGSRPVVYADLATPGYSMTEVLAELAGLGVRREQVRLLSAHYDGEHVCSPARGCKDKDGKVITWSADGTQWTKSFPGVGGVPIDMSALADDFFGPPAEWVFSAVRWLKIISVGPHSVKLSWSSPGTPEAEAVHHYQLTIRDGGQDVPGYPRDAPKGANPEVWQGGSLAPGTVYEALVRACAADGHASPWSAVTFRTPA